MVSRPATPVACAAGGSGSRAAALIAIVAMASFAAVACSSGKDSSEDPVSDEAAAEFQAALNDMADGAGMAATVMTADGTWSGATGKADDVRDVTVNDQFAIGSVTKSIVAAQVMQMVEAGELDLDDPVTNHLPPGPRLRHEWGDHPPAAESS